MLDSGHGVPHLETQQSFSKHNVPPQLRPTVQKVKTHIMKFDPNKIVKQEHDKLCQAEKAGKTVTRLAQLMTVTFEKPKILTQQSPLPSTLNAQ